MVVELDTGSIVAHRRHRVHALWSAMAERSGDVAFTGARFSRHRKYNESQHAPPSRSFRLSRHLAGRLLRARVAGASGVRFAPKKLRPLTHYALRWYRDTLWAWLIVASLFFVAFSILSIAPNREADAGLEKFLHAGYVGMLGLK